MAEEARARIRHIAIGAKDTAELAEFYESTFGMHEVSRLDHANGLAIFISDGDINVAILPCPKATGGREGILHFGFQVADADKTGRIAEAAGASERNLPRPRDGRFAESGIKDPVGTTVDLSEAGWPT
jgi:catechol 2,3-dioxygenase-like lactoylglutathione lyase family enzyme